MNLLNFIYECINETDRQRERERFNKQQENKKIKNIRNIKK